MENRERQITVIKELVQNYDHGFIDEEGVKYFTEPFGFMGSTVMGHDDPDTPKGLRLHKGIKAMKGQDAAITAEEIARKVCNFKPWAIGRGTRLRLACEAVLEYLESGYKGADND